MPTEVMELKGRSLDEWRKWLRNELTPPYANAASRPLTRYMMEAFLELIEKSS